MALSRPFLNGTILFSSISPDYELNLKDELYSCNQYIGIPFDILDKMPVRDRKYYIMRHNLRMQEEQERYEHLQHKNSSLVEGEAINTFAKLEQVKNKNVHEY